jgi:Leucine-rich repeat (LRR) protein
MFDKLINLKSLSLRKNLTKFDGKILTPLTSLKELDLSENKMKTLQTSFLKGISPTVSKLILMQNQISEIQNGAFNELPNLTFLNLQNNSLNFFCGFKHETFCQ